MFRVFSVLLIRFVLCAILMVMPALASDRGSEADAKTYVESVSAKALKILSSKKRSTSHKEKKLTILFLDSIDTKWMGRFVMGRYWREADESQQDEYQELYKKYLVNSYIPRFKEYTNQKINIKKSSRIHPDEYLVETEILQTNAPPIRVDYKLRYHAEKGYVVFDIIAEGISLITTQRSEFGSILSREGVNSLIAKLGAKLKS